MSIREQQALCDYDKEHDWGPLREAEESPDKARKSQWMISECQRCGRIKWVRKQLGDILPS